jgi:hypothetical protein
LFWFVGAWLARPYADTDDIGSSLAEWFAYAVVFTSNCVSFTT